MMRKPFHMTQAGVAELGAELQRLISQRSEVIEHIKMARELGDLSENAEYISARQAQDRIETRIIELQDILKNVKLITRPKQASKVRLGSVVTLRYGGSTLKQLQLVGTVEADPLRGKISDESPFGRVLLDKVVGDELRFNTGTKAIVYTIVSIE
ncbi:MAG TPA: transcription elongation factor GreA [Candidatus Saccharimonadales bacterium]|nr:transcription elongation factor GreA [Candidatus Saccharimonadales bacterium]